MKNELKQIQVGPMPFFRHQQDVQMLTHLTLASSRFAACFGKKKASELGFVGDDN